MNYTTLVIIEVLSPGELKYSYYNYAIYTYKYMYNTSRIVMQIIMTATYIYTNQDTIKRLMYLKSYHCVRGMATEVRKSNGTCNGIPNMVDGGIGDANIVDVLF